jgi:predicted tellurium resistance membrane protein TerC
MSPAFQTGRRSALLTRQLKRARRRRALVLGLAATVLIPALFFLFVCYLERSWELPRERPRREEPDFDPQLVYTKARALLERGKSNEHRGRRDQVEEQYEESLELMLMISEEAPEYQPDRVRRDIEFLRGRLRKVR